ncbi:hypothetical protein ACHQM5_024072 [Ranunculus cassubicifolius]
MAKAHPLEVHSSLPKEYADATGRFGRFYTRRSRNVSTLNVDIPVTASLQQLNNVVPIEVSVQCTSSAQISSMLNEGSDPSFLPAIVDVGSSELPLQMHEVSSLPVHWAGCSFSSHPSAQTRPFESVVSPFHGATRRRAVRSRRTNFDSIILSTGLHKLTGQERNTIRRGRANKILTDEQLAAARAKGAIRQRNARLNQTAEQKAANRAKDTARKRAYRQRLRQAKMLIKADPGNDHVSQLESANKSSTLSSRERATIRKRNSRLKQTAEQRAANRAINTARRRESRQRLRQAKMMMNNDHGNDTHISQPESADNPVTVS